MLVVADAELHISGPPLHLADEVRLDGEQLRVPGHRGRDVIGEQVHGGQSSQHLAVLPPMAGDVPGWVVTAGAGAAVPEPVTHPRAARGRRGHGQASAACTGSTILFSTAGLHLCSAYDTGHRSPSSRLAGSWKPRVEYR